MSYTTEGQPQGKGCSVCNKIQEAMIGELVAINQYEYHIKNSKYDDVNEVWIHIRDEEKKHFKMLLDALREYDPTQMKKYKELHEENIKIKNDLINYYKSNVGDQILLNNIRKDIKGELEAVILYESIICELKDENLIKLIKKITSEEKEHIEELNHLVIQLDNANKKNSDND